MARTIGKSINIIYRNIQAYINSELSEYGITISEVGILMSLYKNNGVRQEQIVKDVGVDKAAIAKSIAIMEKKGFVYREADKNDKRANLVYLTSMGKQNEMNIKKVLENCNNIIAKELNVPDIKKVYRFLDELVEATNILKKGGL